MTIEHDRNGNSTLSSIYPSIHPSIHFQTALTAKLLGGLKKSCAACSAGSCVTSRVLNAGLWTTNEGCHATRAAEIIPMTKLFGCRITLNFIIQNRPKSWDRSLSPRTAASPRPWPMQAMVSLRNFVPMQQRRVHGAALRRTSLHRQASVSLLWMLRLLLSWMVKITETLGWVYGESLMKI